jgi:hypothetical protein
MPSSLSRTVAWFSLGGWVCVSLVLIGLWGPETGLLQDAHRAEVERLFQAISSPLARGNAMNDDLSRIDELSRLQKIPGVASAQINEKPDSDRSRNALVWEGRTVGHLEIRVLKTPWRLWRYRWLERALSLGILFVLAAGALGIFWNRSQQRHRLRVIGMLKREHKRMANRRQIDQARQETGHKRWIGQAMEYASKGLLVLDGNQRVVMANTAAMEHFKLTENILGAHWLDSVGSPEWAAALRRSVENPGARTSGPASTDSLPVFLLTFSKPGTSIPESTWIAVG